MVGKNCKIKDQDSKVSGEKRRKLNFKDKMTGKKRRKIKAKETGK